jgi:hypothetical protein
MVSASTTNWLRRWSTIACPMQALVQQSMPVAILWNAATSQSTELLRGNSSLPLVFHVTYRYSQPSQVRIIGDVAHHFLARGFRGESLFTRSGIGPVQQHLTAPSGTHSQRVGPHVQRQRDQHSRRSAAGEPNAARSRRHQRAQGAQAQQETTDREIDRRRGE